MSTRELRRQAQQRMRSLSRQRLQVAVDFLAYLQERESNEATEELLRIPGLLRTFEKTKGQNKARDWRKVRHDVWVRLLPQAERFYSDADQPLARKLARCFEQLEQNPRSHPNITALKGPLAGYYRYRVGDYRAIYRIDELGKVVVVAIIAHRREAYD